MDSLERKKAATLAKMNAAEGRETPAYELHLKEASEVIDPIDDLTTESTIESDPESATQSDFGISIVGGDPSDPNEFP